MDNNGNASPRRWLPHAAVPFCTNREPFPHSTWVQSHRRHTLVWRRDRTGSLPPETLYPRTPLLSRVQTACRRTPRPPSGFSSPVRTPWHGGPEMAPAPRRPKAEPFSRAAAVKQGLRALMGRGDVRSQAPLSRTLPQVLRAGTRAAKSDPRGLRAERSRPRAADRSGTHQANAAAGAQEPVLHSGRENGDCWFEPPLRYRGAAAPKRAAHASPVPIPSQRSRG